MVSWLLLAFNHKSQKVKQANSHAQKLVFNLTRNGRRFPFVVLGGAKTYPERRTRNGTVHFAAPLVNLLKQIQFRELLLRKSLNAQ